jgi:hypothetical protein
MLGPVRRIVAELFEGRPHLSVATSAHNLLKDIQRNKIIFTLYNLADCWAGLCARRPIPESLLSPEPDEGGFVVAHNDEQSIPRLKPGSGSAAAAVGA